MPPAGAHYLASDFSSALRLIETELADQADQVWVIGGSSLYKVCLYSLPLFFRVRNWSFWINQKRVGQANWLHINSQLDSKVVFTVTLVTATIDGYIVKHFKRSCNYTPFSLIMFWSSRRWWGAREWEDCLSLKFWSSFSATHSYLRSVWTNIVCCQSKTITHAWH